MDYFTAAIEEDPRKVSLFNGRSTALIHLGEFPRSLQDAETIIALDPRSPVVRVCWKRECVVWVNGCVLCRAISVKL